jgi:hypothetical protein
VIDSALERLNPTAKPLVLRLQRTERGEDFGAVSRLLG